MHLLGTASWWLPKWLSRILPRIDVEGAPEPPTAPAAKIATASTRQAAQRTG
jgi:putative drug exporter of the RND superfamily